jgi:hypothetical protein
MLPPVMLRIYLTLWSIALVLALMLALVRMWGADCL